MSIKCNIITAPIRTLANELQISAGDACNLVSVWQTENNSIEMPSSSQLQPYLNRRNQISLELPVYSIRSFSPTSNIAGTTGKSGSYEIYMTDWYKQSNPMELFFNYILGNLPSQTSEQKKEVFKRLEKEGYTIEKVKELLDNVDAASRFLLYHELSHVQNDDQSVYWNQGRDNYLTEDKLAIETRATLEALKKIEETKKSTSTKLIPSNVSMYSGAAKGSDTYWASIGKNYGISVTDFTTKSITAENKDEATAKVMKANESLNRVFPMQPNEKRDAASTEVANNLILRDWLQVKNADSIFAISTINSRGQVDGGTGWAVQMAIDEHKPVYVFNQNDNKWYVYQEFSKQFVETDTPTLTSKFAGIGTRNISNEGKQAIINVYSKTFDVEEEVPQIGTEVLAINHDNPIAKLNRAFNPIERLDRVTMIAKQFSNIVDSLVDDKVEELSAALAETSDLAEKARLSQRLEVMNDSVKGRRAAIEEITVEAIFNRIKSNLESYTEMTAEELDEDYGEGKGAYILDAYQRVLDNFDTLIEEACTLIESAENMRLVVERNAKHTKNTTTEVLGGSTMESAQTAEDLDSSFSDDEDGNRVDGNGGWSFKVRFVDPYTSLSKGVKRVLSNIKKEGYNGEPEVDDLGYIRYVNEEYAHAVLMNELSWMIDANDFCIKNDDGTYYLPALEKVIDKYPWANQVISALQAEPNLISAFYADFRKDFIPYTMYKYDAEKGRWIFFHMNKPTALDSTRTSIIRNYEQSTVLDMDAIYSGGNIHKDKALVGVALMDSSLTLLKDMDEDDYPTIISNTSKALRMLGVNTNDHIISSLLKTEEGIVNLEKVINAAKDIFSGVESMTDGAHLINTFNQEYNTIAELVGLVSELDNVQSFRQGDKSYYSYSAPNYLDTMFKNFKREDRRKTYLKEQFKKYDWFYSNSNGEWRNEWLRQIEEDEDVRDLMQLDELNNIDGVEYTNWQPLDIKKTFIAKYFSAGFNEGSKKQFAWYNFPIFSDSPVVKFIKFTRYTDNFKEQLLPLFNKVVKQELSRIKLVQERRNKGVTPIANFDKNGTKFHFFPQLNEYKVGDKTFLKAIVDAANKGDTKLVDTTINNAISNIMEVGFQEFLINHFTKDSKDELADFLLSEGAISSLENLDKALEEYYWNQSFATSQIIQLTTTDLAYYKNGVDFQKRYKEVYAAGTKLNTLSKYGRTTEKTVYLSDQIVTSANYTDIKTSLDDALKAGHITKADRNSILSKFRDINVADAQAYRSLSSMRAVLDMMGAWTPEMQSSMDRFKSGEWDMTDFNTVWQTIKPFVFTQIEKPDGLGGVIKVPHQNKNSEFLLLAMYSMIASSTGASPKMKAINRFMEDNEIDVVQFESSVKAGKQGCIDINYSPKKLAAFLQSNPIPDVSSFEEFKEFMDNRLDEGSISQEHYNSVMEQLEPSEEEVYKTLNKAIRNGDNSLNNEVVHEIPYSDYVIQQPTPEHLFDVTDAVYGSQFRNLIISDMPDDPNFRVRINGKDYTKREILDLYQALIVENLLEDFTKVKGRFENIDTLQAAMLQQIKGNPKYGRDMVNALEIVEIVNPVTGKAERVFNIPLNNPSTTTKIQEITTSMFKNAVTKQTIRGGACILVSNFGLTDELHILHNEDGSIKGAECYLPAYSKQFYTPFLVSKKDEQGNEYQELDVDKMPNELKRLVGYRIPTEDKYSMIPLIIKGFLPQQNGSAIMVPADITQIAGSDFDVDKMFLMIPEFKVTDEVDWKKFTELVMRNEGFKKWGKDNVRMTIDMIKNGNISFSENSPEMHLYDYYTSVKDDLITTKVKKVKYDVAKSPQEQSRAARNNMLIDIAYGILTNKDTAEKIHNPGNFDRAKTGARIATILSDVSLLNQFMEEHGINDYSKAGEYLLKSDLATLDEFVEAHREERNPLSIDTFIYNHRQNMTGGALIGMYANNTTMQAKFQVTGLGIKGDHTFFVNGRKIQSLSNITSETGERISKNCANFSAASVDNVKDPVLADLMQNIQTANIAGFMLRAGMSIEEISLLFTQPLIKQCILESGSLKSLPTNINRVIRALRKKGGDIDLKQALVHDFTSKELIMNIINNLHVEDLSKGEYTDHLVSSIRAALLMLKISRMANDLSSLTQIARADSPNGAISTSIAGAKLQVQRVNAYHRKSKDISFYLTGVQDVMKNNFVTIDMSKEEMREKLLKSKMPMLQTFYSLGIELGAKAMAPFFAQSTPYVDTMVDKLFLNSPYGVFKNEVILDTFYNELVEFGLTKTKLFGDDGSRTYDEKRDYYLYEYPSEFLKVLAANPQIANLNIMRKIQVKKGEIILERSGRLTPMMRESLMRDLDTLLYRGGPVSQKLAVDLMMYSFYKDGFKFGPNSYGDFFSTSFLNTFPEFVTALREMQFNMREGTYFDRYLPQFYANHYRDGILPILSSEEVEELDNGQLLVKTSKARNRNIGGNSMWQMIVYEGNLYTVDTNSISKEYAVYSPSYTVNDPQGAKYNANMTVEQLASVQVNKDKVDAAKKINSKRKAVSITEAFDSAYLESLDDVIASLEMYNPEDSQSQLEEPLC